MPTNKPVSVYLRQLQADLNGLLAENGHIHLDRVTAARLIAHLGNLTLHATHQEIASLAADLSRRSFADRLMLLADMNEITSNVLRLMRSGLPGEDNVVVFRPKPRPVTSPATPPDGDAA